MLFLKHFLIYANKKNSNYIFPMLGKVEHKTIFFIVPKKKIKDSEFVVVIAVASNTSRYHHYPLFAKSDLAITYEHKKK